MRCQKSSTFLKMRRVFYFINTVTTGIKRQMRSSRRSSAVLISPSETIKAMQDVMTEKPLNEVLSRGFPIG